MRRPYEEDGDSPVTEMAVVDTFTKLIFCDEQYTERELSIIDALRAVNHDVLRDSYAEMGEYLRNLGVREMIQLVARVRQHMAEGAQLPGTMGSSVTSLPTMRTPRGGRH